MPKLMRGIGLLLAVACLALSLLLVHRITVGTQVLAWSHYSYAELLINYRSGFVRRGLIGFVISRASRGGPWLRTANELLFWNYAVFSLGLFLLSLLKPRFRGWIAAMVLLIPGGVFHMAFLKDGFQLKEMFFFTYLVLIGGCLYLARLLPLGPIRIATRSVLCVLIWAGGFICSLIHEGFFFLCAPAAAYQLIACRRLVDDTLIEPSQQVLGDTRAAYRFLALIAVSFLCSAVIFHGGVPAMVGIWNSLPLADHAILGPNGLGGIGSLAAGPRQLWFEPLMELQSGMAWWYLAPIMLLLTYCCGLVALGMDESKADSSSLWRWFCCYVTLMLCAMPMFVLGWDWGRWINCVDISFVIVWLSVPDGELADLWSGLSLPHLRNWVARHRVRLRFEHLLAYVMSVAKQHPGVSVSALLLFALTFHLPSQFLSDSYIFIGRTGTDWIVSTLQAMRH
jgi:hypothetical protein